MSLKVRLTLLYTSIVGGIFILFSVGLYALISITLNSQIDEALEDTWYDVQRSTRVNLDGELETLSLTTIDANVFIQAWGQDGNLKMASFSIQQLQVPLDEQFLGVQQPIYNDSYVGDVHLRVLSVPLRVGGRPFGTMQIATSLQVVDATLQNLITVLGASFATAVIFALLMGLVSTQMALEPLEHATTIANQITESNDLSRRIPQTGPTGDEVDQFVAAFNQNLTKLERLIESQRRFLADVGHELRTPLTVIRGNASLIQRIGEVDEESLVSIQQEVDRMNRLVGDLVLLAQAESGKLPMAKYPVELDSLLLDVFRQTSVLANEKAINLRVGEIDQMLICGDKDRLAQVVINLITNGIKYTPPGGDVILSLTKNDANAILQIEDNGPGIPEKDLQHIFERFYRAEKARSRSKDGKGFGLGLSIAYWIVVNHDGRIHVESQEGQGTVFKVYLPLSDGDCGEEITEVEV